MFLRPWAMGSVLFFAVSLNAQTQSASATSTPPDPAAQTDQPTPMRSAQTDVVDAKIQQALRERDAIIRNLLQRVQELETRLNATNSGLTGHGAVPGAVAAAPPPVVSSLATTVNNATYDDTERHASAALDRALLVRGGLLLPAGMLEVDDAASYFSLSSDHVIVNGFALFPVLVVGDITSERLRRDILINTVTARVGLTKKLQMDYMLPYGYVLNRTVDATGKQTTASQFGLGDMVAGLSYQFASEHGSMPDLLGSVHFKSTTGVTSYNLESAETSLGTGFNSINAAVTAAKTNDPLVFFGSLNYTYNQPAHHTVPISNPSNPDMATEAAYIRPGSSIGFDLGSVLSLNPETSMTIGWDQLFTQQSKLNGQVLPASYLVEGSLRVGTSYMFAPGRMLDVTMGVGLTPDTPNLQFSVSFPFRRTLWKPSY
jgi:outer membrane putative beta-barrel porin/alpha-amylase